MSSRYKMLVGQGLISVLFVTLASIPTSIGFLETYFYVIPPKGTISVIDSTRNGTVILQVEDQAAVVEYNDEIYPEIKVRSTPTFLIDENKRISDAFIGKFDHILSK